MFWNALKNFFLFDSHQGGPFIVVMLFLLSFFGACDAEKHSKENQEILSPSLQGLKTSSKKLLHEKPLATRSKSAPIIEKFIDKGDLPFMKKKKLLRVLTLEEHDVFLQNGGIDDRVLAQEFADSLGLKVVFITQKNLDALFEKLAAGEGDLIAARITVTQDRQKKVSFARPTRVVDEVVVGRTDATEKSLADLKDKTIGVWRNSSHEQTLRNKVEAEKTSLVIESAAEGVDDEMLLQKVASQEIDFTVADSDIFSATRYYTPNIKVLFKLKESVEIAWAMRKENSQLKAAADQFVIEKALTSHAQEFLKADLAEIQKRGSIRVLTRNNPVTYFLHRGQARGFDYDLAKLVAKALKVRLEVVVPPDASQLIPWLNEGRGDFIAASFTVSDERKKKVHFSMPYLFVDEVLVGKKGQKKVKNKEDLKAQLVGKKIMVRKSSSYYTTLQVLHHEFGGVFEIELADESWETEEILKKVRTQKGSSLFTVADSHILAVEQTYSDELVQVFALTQAAENAVDPKGKPRVGAKELAFATRKDAPKLQAFLDGFVKKIYRGLEYNMAKKKYFQNKRRIMQAKASTAEKGKLSPYDDLIRKYSQRYGLDWRLMAAQAFQESRFNPAAKSWVGAKGLFQVMPATGKEMGFVDLENPEIGTHAGIRYMAKMIALFDKKIPFKQRIRFALASYNAGRGHVLDAMRLARQQGLNPHKWFGHVEKTMLQLAEPKVAKRVRHGYCRGQEPVNYVSQIQLRYDNWVKITAE